MSKEKVSSTAVTPVKINELGEMVEVKNWVMALPAADGDEDASERIMQRILDAETSADILTPEKGEGLRDHVGEELVIHDARWRPSTQNKVIGAFLVLDVELVKTGEHRVMTTGANNVVAQIVAHHNKGLMPFACRVTETPSKSDPNNKIQWLVSADAF